MRTVGESCCKGGGSDRGNTVSHEEYSKSWQSVLGPPVWGSKKRLTEKGNVFPSGKSYEQESDFW